MLSITNPGTIQTLVGRVSVTVYADVPGVVVVVVWVSKSIQETSEQHQHDVRLMPRRVLETMNKNVKKCE